MKKIAVIGPHCANRYDMTRALSIWFSSRGSDVRDVVTYSNQYCLDTFDEKTADVDLEKAIFEAIQRERRLERKECDVLICDGCIYEPYVYYTVQKDWDRASNTIDYYLMQYVIAYMSTYDVLLYVKPSLTPIDPPESNDRKAMQLKIDEIYQEQLIFIQINLEKIFPERKTVIIYIDQNEVLTTPNLICERVQKCL